MCKETPSNVVLPNLFNFYFNLQMSLFGLSVVNDVVWWVSPDARKNDEINIFSLSKLIYFVDEVSDAVFRYEKAFEKACKRKRSNSSSWFYYYRYRLYNLWIFVQWWNQMWEIRSLWLVDGIHLQLIWNRYIYLILLTIYGLKEKQMEQIPILELVIQFQRPIEEENLYNTIKLNYFYINVSIDFNWRYW